MPARRRSPRRSRSQTKSLQKRRTSRTTRTSRRKGATRSRVHPRYLTRARSSRTKYPTYRSTYVQQSRMRRFNWYRPDTKISVERMFEEIESTFRELFPGMGWDVFDGLATAFLPILVHDIHAAFTKETREMYCARTLIAFSCWAMSPDSRNLSDENGRTWLRDNKERVKDLFVFMTGSLNKRYEEILDHILNDTFEDGMELQLPDMQRGKENNVLLDMAFLGSQSIIYLDANNTLKFRKEMKDGKRIYPTPIWADERLTPEDSVLVHPTTGIIYVKKKQE